MALSVKRYSAAQLEASLTIRGRGIYFSRTPDGRWFKLRLRPHRCDWPTTGNEGGPPDIGVREPRRPTGPSRGSVASLELP